MMRAVSFLAVGLAIGVAGCTEPGVGENAYDAIMAKAREVALDLDTPVKAAAAGYVPANVCFPGEGVHWNNPTLLDGRVDLDHPETVMFLPPGRNLTDPASRFLGIEYVVPTGGTSFNETPGEPSLLGQPFFGPMQHGLGGIWHKEIHIWLGPGHESDAAFTQRTPAAICPPGTETLPTRMGLGACMEHVAMFPIESDAAASSLPPGFEARPFAGQAGTATLRIEAYACGKGEGIGWDPEMLTQYRFDTGPSQELIVFLEVDPPDELRAPNVTSFGIPLAALTSSPEAAKTYTAWGVPSVALGSVNISMLQTLPALRVGQARAAGPIFSVTMDVAASGQTQVQAPEAARLFRVGEGSVIGAYDVDKSSSNEIVTGHVVARFEGDAPFPTPIGPGIGQQAWADDESYAFNMTYRFLRG